MTSAPGRHPSDAERAEAARPVLDELVAAAGAGDAARVAACLDEDAVWLGPAGPAAGRDEAARRLLAAARDGDPAAPVQHGAHALLRWTGAAGAAGGVVVEVRRARVVLVAAL